MNRPNPLLAYISDEKNQNFVLQLVREVRRWVTDYREQDIIRGAMEEYESSDLVQYHIENRDREKDRASLELRERPLPEVGFTLPGVGGSGSSGSGEVGSEEVDPVPVEVPRTRS
jgi:hypothetical protein